MLFFLRNNCEKRVSPFRFHITKKTNRGGRVDKKYYFCRVKRLMGVEGRGGSNVIDL